MTFEEQVVTLRAEYSKVERIDPSEPTYDALCTFLDGMDTEKLELLAAAKIKWLSMLANNRLIRRKMNAH